MDGGAWWAIIVHGFAKSRTRLSNFTFTSLLVINSTSKKSVFSYTWGWQTFLKGQIVNTLGFTNIEITLLQLLNSAIRTKAAIDNT